MNQEIIELVNQVSEKCLQNKLTLSTAESCTGGGIATAFTELAGSSSWFEAGIVSYSNNAKNQLLGVPFELIDQFGAVSQEVVESMLSGVLQKTSTSAAVAVTGIAGPDGGTEEKPVGTVWIAWQKDEICVVSQRFLFLGNRYEIRQQTIVEALKGFISLV